MTWPEALQAAIDEFADVFDPMERYEMLFEWASEVNELPAEEWNDGNIIHWCQSQAHVTVSYTHLTLPTIYSV